MCPNPMVSNTSLWSELVSKLVFYLNWKPEDCSHKPIHFYRCFQEYLAVFLSGTYPSVLESSLWTTSATDVFRDSEIEFLPPDLKGHFLCDHSPKSNYDCLVSNGSRVIITFFNFLSRLNEKDKTLHVGRTSSITENYWPVSWFSWLILPMCIWAV